MESICSILERSGTYVIIQCRWEVLCLRKSSGFFANALGTNEVYDVFSTTKVNDNLTRLLNRYNLSALELSNHVFIKCLFLGNTANKGGIILQFMATDNMVMIF